LHIGACAGARLFAVSVAYGIDKSATRGDMTNAENLDRPPSSGAWVIKLVFTACDIGVGGALARWFWPSGVMDVPLAAVSMPMLLSSAAAILMALGAVLMLAAVWSSDGAERVSQRR